MEAKSKYFLIVNLIAGQGRCKELFPKVKLELDRRKINYDLHFTNEPMEAVDVAKMGIEAGFPHIVAMGGDGTVNEIANGLLGTNATLAVIPAGTGNDFIRMLGIPGNPMQAIDTLLNGVARTMDLGQVEDDRCFVNGLGIGIDAQVARAVLKMERLKGAAAYLTAAVREVFRFQAFPVTISRGLGDVYKRQTYAQLAIIRNGSACSVFPRFVPGNMRIGRTSSIDKQKR